MGIAIATEHTGLEEHQGRAPDGRGAAEPGQNDFRDQRLNQEQQTRADDHSDGV